MKNNAVKRKKKRRTSLYLVMLLIGIFLSSLVVQGVSLRADCKKLAAQQTELQNKKKELKKEKKAIAEKKEYMKTDEYIEELAREKFGLVYNNEIIFKAKE